MHEIGIAQELSEIVFEVADKENLIKVTKVNISFGQMVQIVPEIFDFAFRETVRDTIAATAELTIELIPVKLRCRKCNKEFVINDNNFSCNNCSSTDLDIIQGKEIFVKSIEGE
jgi:hydrogenase nickel incorporation protein HypA/HybF